MKICLFICSQYPPYPHGGVGSFAVDLAEGIVEKGHEVICISINSPEILNSEKPLIEFRNGVKLLRVPNPYQNYPKRPRKILEKFYFSGLVRNLYKQEHFDILEAEDGLGMLALGDLPQVPKVVRLHASQIYNDFVLERRPSRLDHIFEKKWINRSDYIVAVSDFVGSTTLNLVKSKKNYDVIHHAIDTEFYIPDNSITPEPGLIVFTGTVAPRKGALELIQSMNIVFSKSDAAHLLIVGDDKYPSNKAPFSMEIIQYLSEQYKNRVKFTGVQPRSALPSYLQKAELCCFPSHVETFGIGVVEAMACEKPVIYMKTDPGPEVIEDSVSGLLCDTYDPVDIAEKVLFLLNNPDIGKKMGKRARERVIQKFGKKSWVERNLDFYQACIRNYR